MYAFRDVDQINAEPIKQAAHQYNLSKTLHCQCHHITKIRKSCFTVGIHIQSFCCLSWPKDICKYMMQIYSGLMTT